MEKRIRIGVLSCADIADRLMIPAIKASGKFELVAVASRDVAKAQAFAQKFECEAIGSYEELVARPDIEAIYVPLPTGMHAEWGAKILQAGKHVLLEKSLATTLDEAQHLVALAQEKGLALKENFMFQYHSQHKFVFDLLANDAIGAIRSFRSSFGFPPFKDATNIRYSKALGGGALLDAGAYTLKAARWFLGDSLQVKAASLVFEGKEVDIHGTAYALNDAGIAAELAFGFDHFYQCSYEIWGSKGKITATRAFTAAPGFQPTVIVERQGEREEHLLPADNHFVNLLQDFADFCQNPSNFAHEYEALVAQASLIQAVNNICKQA